jgi:hypothetical protein
MFAALFSQGTVFGDLPSLKFALGMERGQYNVTIAVSDAQSHSLAEIKCCATEFFTQEGHFARSLFDAKLDSLLKSASKKGQ